MEGKTDLVVILGPTAGGKTHFAAHLAHRYSGEVISADSRQVYREMDLGTGKDLEDYLVEGLLVPFHLINLVDPGYRYSLYEFQRDFLSAYNDIVDRNRVPVLCGGTGLYLESVIRGYHLVEVQPDPKFRAAKESLSMEELIRELGRLGPLHNTTDITNKKRLIRVLEIAYHTLDHPVHRTNFPRLNTLIIGIRYDRQTERHRITERLQRRLEMGLVEEVKTLMERIGPEAMMFYGLEYRYVAQFCLGELSYLEMFNRLNTAIHQFAKRQMTWFRKMEKNGIDIHWIDGMLTMHQKLAIAEKLLQMHFG